MKANQFFDEFPYALTWRLGFSEPVFFTVREVRFTAPVFKTATCLNLCIGHFATPLNLSLPNPVMGSAWLLPVSNRRTQTWTGVGFIKFPLRRAKWRTDLYAASAGAKMSCSSEFLRCIQHAGLKDFRHVVNALKTHAFNLWHRMRFSGLGCRRDSCCPARRPRRSRATA